MNRRLQIFLVGFLLYFSANAQNQTANWYFGLKTGINFNTTPPSAHTNGNLLSSEGAAAISSADGELLFYTNGQTIWNKEHRPMFNGSGLLGSSNSTQSSIIVPKPNSNKIYYVFTLDDLGGFNGLQYSEVDISAKGGLGAVTGNKNIKLQNSLTEKLTAVRHGNGKDYWVLVHGNGSNQFYAYKVTALGVGTTATTTIIGSTHTNVLGYMKFSPDGKKVACAAGGTDNFVEVFDFDDKTGKLNNPMKLSYSSSPYGIEFSPNSQLLYISLGKSIFQYTLPKVSNSGLLSLSENEIKTDAQVWGLQLGLDKRIYACKQSNRLSIIGSPNDNSGNEDFTDNVFVLSNVAVQGLPNQPQHYLNNSLISAENTCVSQQVRFKVLLNEPDSIQWNFGDGKFISSLTPTHIYNKSGSYTVRAKVYTSGYSETISKVIEIEELPTFSLGADTILCKGQYLNYNFSIAGAKYLWNNGKTNPLRRITTPGVHYLDVTAKGCTIRDSITIAYNFVNPSFDINNANQCIVGNTFEFTATSKNSIKNTWFIDDVFLDDEEKTNTSFVKSGSYKIKLEAIETSGCKDSIIKIVTVNTTPKANFSIVANNTCGKKNSFTFTNTTVFSGKNTYEFSIEGRTIKNKPVVNWTFSKVGDHKVSLLVKTDKGCEDIIEKTITVYPAPDADFDIITNSHCLANNSFTFIFDKTLKAFETLSWNVDGKAIAGKKSFTESFTATGKYTISAKIENTSGCKEVVSKTVTVFENPTANFTTSSNTFTCLGKENIAFTNLSSSNLLIINHNWSFGDNTTSSSVNPVKSYTSQASYLVTLTIKNEPECISKITKSINTYEQPDVSVQTKTISACEENNAFDISYTDNNPSAAISSVTWLSNDNITIPSQNPARVSFTSSGTYKLDLEVETIHGCKDNASTTIKVNPTPTGSIQVNNVEQCLNNNTFEATIPTNHNGINISSFTWELGASSNTISNNIALFTYDKIGDFDISARVIDENGCEAIFNQQVTVNPIPEFTIVSAKGCVGKPITLGIDNLSPFIVVNNWEWDLGNGVTSSLLSPVNTYNEARTYSLSAKATSSKGCSYTTLLKDGVEINPKPIVDFEHKRVSWNFEETILEFEASSSINTNDFIWNFGNGKSSTKTYARVDFTDPGYYQVSLTAKTAKGCEGSIAKTILIVPPFDAYVPTSFTPNGDGINDFFGMEGVEYIGTFEMSIYNRWGQKMFTSTNVNNQWDGRYNDTPMPPGMYTFTIVIADAEGRPYEINGTIQLIR